MPPVVCVPLPTLPVKGSHPAPVSESGEGIKARREAGSFWRAPVQSPPVSDPPPIDSLLLNDALRERVAEREAWGEAGWGSWRELEAEAARIGLEDIFLIARAGLEQDPLDRVIAVAVMRPWESAPVVTGVAPILEAAWRAVRYLQDDVRGRTSTR